MSFKNENEDGFTQRSLFNYVFDAPMAGNFYDLPVDDVKWFESLNENQAEYQEEFINHKESSKSIELIEEDKENSPKCKIWPGNDGIQRTSTFGLAKSTHGIDDMSEEILKEVNKSFDKIDVDKYELMDSKMSVVSQIKSLEPLSEVKEIKYIPEVSIASSAPIDFKVPIVAQKRFPVVKLQTNLVSTVKKPIATKPKFTFSEVSATAIKPKQAQTMSRFAMTTFKPAMSSRVTQTLPRIVSKKPLTIARGPTFLSRLQNNAKIDAPRSATLERKIIPEQKLIRAQTTVTKSFISERKIVSERKPIIVQTPFPKSRILDHTLIKKEKTKNVLTTITTSVSVTRLKPMNTLPINSHSATLERIKPKQEKTLKNVQTPAPRAVTLDRKIVSQKTGIIAKKAGPKSLTLDRKVVPERKPMNEMHSASSTKVTLNRGSPTGEKFKNISFNDSKTPRMVTKNVDEKKFLKLSNLAKMDASKVVPRHKTGCNGARMENNSNKDGSRNIKIYRNWNY